MRTLIIAAVLALMPACSLFQSQERSQLSQAPDAGIVNDGCHGTQDAGTHDWPDGAPDDGGGYLPDGGWVPDAWPTSDGGSWLPDAGGWSSDAGSWSPDAGSWLPDAGH